MIVDARTDGAAAPWGFVVFTDSFLSGWGQAEGGRSLYALAVSSPEEADTVLASGKRRTDMKRGRIVRTFKGLCKGTRERDHLMIVDRGEASRWYEPNGFAD